MAQGATPHGAVRRPGLARQWVAVKAPSKGGSATSTDNCAVVPCSLRCSLRLGRSRPVHLGRHTVVHRRGGRRAWRTEPTSGRGPSTEPVRFYILGLGLGGRPSLLSFIFYLFAESRLYGVGGVTKSFHPCLSSILPQFRNQYTVPTTIKSKPQFGDQRGKRRCAVNGLRLRVGKHVHRVKLNMLLE